MLDVFFNLIFIIFLISLLFVVFYFLKLLKHWESEPIEVVIIEDKNKTDKD